jgi:hypothetical protein
MLAVLRRLEARVYGGGTADGPPVRGVRARTTTRASGLLGTGALGTRGLGMERLGPGVASGGVGADAGARPAVGGDGGARARATSRRDALWAHLCCWCPVHNVFLKIFEQN